MDGDHSEDAIRRAEEQRHNWVNAHMGRTSKETAARLLSTPQPAPPPNAPTITLHGVKARCVAGGASNFWILGSPAAEPTLEGAYPLIGISPTAYFVQAPEFNSLPYAVERAGLSETNHRIRGDTAPLEADMRDVYG
ncbi:MAG: hypothetical protein M3Z37_09960 [Candidatus Eremiobacteraeota bacterium]|nr:hypothetical protein [Candidatus Eremiobacteraeota bacterium]